MFLKTIRGSVAPWECDIVEHFTVAYYFDKLSMASERLLIALGYKPSGPHFPALKSCFVRYMKELRAGDLYSIDSGVLDSSAVSLTLGHRFNNTETGDVCTVVEQTFEVQAAPRNSAYNVAWQAPERKTYPPIATDQSWFVTAADIVQPHEVDWRGNLNLAGFVHRFSAASGHIQAKFGMTPGYQRRQRIGFSTFEFQMRFVELPRSGDIVEVQTCIAHCGKSSLRFFHQMRTPPDARLLAELSQSGVHFDKDARRPTALPEALATTASALVAVSVQP